MKTERTQTEFFNSTLCFNSVMPATKNKNSKMAILVLGAKEYPFGASDASGEDVFASGGMESYTQQLAPLLARNRGRVGRVIVLTRKFRGQPSRENLGGVEIVRVGWLHGFLLRNPSFNVNALREAVFMPKRSFNVIIANGVMATLAALKIRFLRRLAGERVRVIARPAGVAWVQPQYNAFVKLGLLFCETLAYKLADAVVFLSPQERAQFEKKMGFLPKRAALIPTGVSVERFSKANGKQTRKRLGLKFGLKQNEKLVVFVGRLMQVKGVDYLVRAMHEVKAELKAKLLVIGDGPLRERLEEISKENGLTEKIFFEKNAEIPECLAAADVFVLPSLSEGLPIALLEAMAAGKACVVTDIGLPVRDGVDGIVVPPRDSKALAKALNRVLADDALRTRLGENAFAAVKKEFNWDDAVEKYLNLAQKLTEN
jgi:glycosyltransferase involved in cell wall biosynthesis